MKLDNAGGGRRGLRATPAPEVFAALHTAYQIDVAPDVVDLGGSSSLNLLVTDHQRHYVLRVYRPYVTKARLEAIQRVRRALATQHVPCPEVVLTQDGHSWTWVAGRLMELESYVAYEQTLDSWARLELGLPLLGRIHTLLREVKVSSAARQPMFANALDPHATLARTLVGTRRIRAWEPSPAERWLADAADVLAHHVSRAEQDRVALLPRQLVHGDFWDNNVGFRDGQVVLVTDFEFVGQRARIDDLALTLYFTLLSLVPAEGGVSDDWLWKLRGLVESYNRGLADPLTPLERAALPLAIARQPLWSIGGWVALLDEEASAREHAAALGGEVALALRIVHELERWQAAFV